MTGIRLHLCILAILLSSAPGTFAQGIITTIAGDGITQYIGDGTPATNYSLAHPESIFVDKAGNVFIADNYNQRIRKLTPGGTLSTLAGNGTTGYAGDGGPAAAAIFNKPNGIFLDTAGNMYITEWYNNVVRKVNATTGIINTIAGNGGGGFSGDGGPATAAHMETPGAACTDAAGNLYIPDYGNHRIRKVTTATGIISTIAGNGTNGYSGDGGAATAAKLAYPVSLCLDAAGNIFFAEYGNNIIRKIDATTGIISTVAGNGSNGYSGDHGPATAAALSQPNAVFVDKNGIIFISENGNNVIRKVGTSGIITTIVGTGVYSYTGDGGPATAATLYNPYAVFVDTAGSLYIADAGNSVIRKVTQPISAVQHIADSYNTLLYPNPSTGTFSLDLPAGAAVSISNILGQCIYAAQLRAGIHSIAITDAPAGVYTVQIIHSNSSQILKYYKEL